MIKPWEQNWKLIEPLGHGGQGSTFLVTQGADPTQRAVLKELIRVNDADARIRMFQEVNNLRAVHSSGAKVPRYRDGNTESYGDKYIPLYFVMEFIEGATLSALIKESGPMPLDTAVEVSLDLCRSIHIGHAKGVLHRDLKPQNIVIRGSAPPDAVILDYGLSFNLTDSQDITSQNESIENSFLSLPEGKAPGDNRRDTRSDITAVCGILYYCLTGHYPGLLQDSSGNPPHRRKGRGFPECLSKLPNYHRLNALLDRGFAVLINSRFRDVAELQSRLQELLQPNLPDYFDDPSAVARDAMEELLKFDRLTQLHSFAANVRRTRDALYQEVLKVGGDLSGFMLGFGGAGTWPGVGPPPDCEMLQVDPIITSLSSGRQTVGLFLVWFFCADQEECYISQAVYLRRGGSAAEMLQPHSAVFRWPAKSTIEVPALMQVFKRSLSSTIRAYVDIVRESTIS